MIIDKQEELELEEFDDDTRTVEPSYIETEDVQENILRPKYLSDFQGQNELKENLKIYIDAAKKRGEALDHIFLQGPPGLGKTTLASIIANEMGADIKLTSATALDKPKDLVGILTNLSKGSILFIDEIHGLKKSMEETLYVAMEDYKIDWVIGQGPAARTMKIDLEPFTLIGATTRTGAVSKPLENRFGIPVKIDLYSPEELSLIIRRSARILNTDITDDAVMAIARCSRGTPRIANRILRRVRDIAQVKGNGTITREMAGIGLEKLGIDKYGLDKTDREILRVIIEIYNGGPVGLEALAAFPNVTVIMAHDSLAVAIAKRLGVGYLVRGIRNAKDLEYEADLAFYNHHLAAEIESVFLLTAPQWQHISSSRIRELIAFQADIADFVPKSVMTKVEEINDKKQWL